MLKMNMRFVMTLTFLLLNGFVTADVYMKQKVTQPEAKDKKNIEQIQETWITDTKVRTNTGDQSTIFDVGKNMLITIDHAKKKYTEIPLDFSIVSSDENQQDTNDLPSFMQKFVKMEVSVQPTDEKKQIGEWNCQKYLQMVNMAMVTTESEIWASQDIHVNTEVYQKFSAALMASQPGFYKILQDMMKESEKIKGVVVLQKTASKVIGKTMETMTELLEVKEVDAPADLFTVPAGYKKEKFKEE